MIRRTIAPFAFCVILGTLASFCEPARADSMEAEVVFDYMRSNPNNFTTLANSDDPNFTCDVLAGHLKNHLRQYELDRSAMKRECLRIHMRIATPKRPRDETPNATLRAKIERTQNCGDLEDDAEMVACINAKK
jgi:hypothetical protein